MTKPNHPKIILTRNVTMIPMQKIVLNFNQYILSFNRNKNYALFVPIWDVAHGFIKKIKIK